MFSINLLHYLFLSSWLFALGTFGIMWHRRNLLLLLLSIEVTLLAANINFVSFAHHLNQPLGLLFTVFIFAIASAEVAIGLAIFIVYFREHKKLQIGTPLLKG